MCSSTEVCVHYQYVFHSMCVCVPHNAVHLWVFVEAEEILSSHSSV